MTIFKIIAAYIMAGFAMIIFSSIIGLLFKPLLSIGKKNKSVAPVITFIISLFPMSLALLSFVWFCNLIDIQPTYLMFIIPFVFLMKNNFNRIDKAKKGQTGTERLAKRMNEAYDSKLQIKMEYGYLFGDSFGIILFLIFLNKLPLY